jgi:hypothetical protein
MQVHHPPTVSPNRLWLTIIFSVLVSPNISDIFYLSDSYCRWVLVILPIFLVPSYGRIVDAGPPPTQHSTGHGLVYSFIKNFALLDILKYFVFISDAYGCSVLVFSCKYLVLKVCRIMVAGWIHFNPTSECYFEVSYLFQCIWVEQLRYFLFLCDVYGWSVLGFYLHLLVLQVCRIVDAGPLPFHITLEYYFEGSYFFQCIWVEQLRYFLFLCDVYGWSVLGFYL